MKIRLPLVLFAAIFLSRLVNAAPSVTSFTPNFGANGDLNPILINGSGFFGGTLVVRFGGPSGTLAPTANASTDNQIQVFVPAGASLGAQQVYVSVGANSTLSSALFTVIGPGPYINNFTPSGGGVGQSVIITGSHFTGGSGGAAVVKFNGKVATVGPKQDDSLTVTVPPGATTGPITVERSGPGTAAGTNTTLALFYVNPVIKSFSPVNGRAGTNVVIQGTNFTGATSVSFNGISSFNLFNVTSNQLTVAVPAGATTGPIQVSTPAPNPAFTTSNFVVLPLITGFTPNFGRPGTNVTIFGENLLGATAVSFGAISAGTPTGISYGQLTTVVPQNATNGFITVTTPNGTFTSSQLFYLPPSISAFTPSNSAAFTTVKITGVNFLGATDVSFNGTPAVGFTVTNNTTIGAIVPSGVFTGPISVTTPYGTTNSGTNLVFYGVPIVSGFIPASGLPGTNVIISGTNFFGATAVLFNGVNAASFTNLPNGTISAVVPTNAATGPISVTGPAGTGASAGSFVLNYNSDLGVTVTAPTSVLLGNNFTYVIVITNRGPSIAPNVALTNTLPGSVSLQFASASPGMSLVTSGNPITASLSSLAVGSTATVTLTVKPQVTGLITDTAIVASGYADLITTNNSSAVSTTIYVVPVLAIAGPSNNTISISWSVALSDYNLQSNSDLKVTNGWSDVGTVPDFVGDQKVVTEPIGSGPKFYRLKQMTAP